MANYCGINYCDETTYATLRTLRKAFNFPQPSVCSGYLGTYVRPSAGHAKIYEPTLVELLSYIHARIRAPQYPTATEVEVTMRSANRAEARTSIGPKIHVAGTGRTEVLACINLMMQLRAYGLGGKAEIVDLDATRARKKRIARQ